MMVNINSIIEEVTNQGIFLHESYEIWLNLVHPNLNSEYEKALYGHEELKKIILESLFSSMVITISMLCEKSRNDVLSLHGIIKELESIYPNLPRSVEQILNPIDSELVLLSQIRHKIYAHRDKNISPQSAFSLVNMSPERIACCISSILNALDLINCTVGLKSKFGVTMEALNKTDEVKKSLSTLLFSASNKQQRTRSAPLI